LRRRQGASKVHKLEVGKTKAWASNRKGHNKPETNQHTNPDTWVHKPHTQGAKGSAAPEGGALRALAHLGEQGGKHAADAAPDPRPKVVQHQLRLVLGGAAVTLQALAAAHAHRLCLVAGCACRGPV